MTQLATQPGTNGGGSMATGEVVRRGLVVDSGQFMNLLDSNRFEHLWRVAQLFSASQMVPAHFQNQPSNCFIALQMAMRMDVEPFMFMQASYIVHGKPGLEAKLVIALINSSGLFSDPLDYEIEGDDPFHKNYRVRAFAKRESTGKVIYGPWIDWKMVGAEGWDKKNGSKWLTMPGPMFQYRAASFFGRLNCPERLMGMQTKEELDDTPEPAMTQPAPPRGADAVLARVSNRGVKKASELPPLELPQQQQTKDEAGAAEPLQTTATISGPRDADAPASSSESQLPAETQEETAPAAIEQGDESQQRPSEEEEAEAELTLALSQPWEKVEKMLLDKAKDLGVTVSNRSGGMFKWKTANPDALKNPKHPARRDLFVAIVNKSFDYAKGVIVEQS